MDKIIRRVVPEDKPDISYVESQSTPGLRYLDEVFSEFSQDQDGDFSVVEIDGQVVGCGKLTPMPDGSAWLESLRVLPLFQGLGVGKLFYTRFFQLAQERRIPVVRMYTNEANAKSKGLAERFGFREVAAYRGYILPAQEFPRPVGPTSGWEMVQDPQLAAELIMPMARLWDGFMVMNRTFYAIVPALARVLAAQGQVFLHSPTNSLLVLGSRFMPQQALHIGLINQELSLGLSLALDSARQRGVERLQVMFPPDRTELEDFFRDRGFAREKQDLVVMEATLTPG